MDRVLFGMMNLDRADWDLFILHERTLHEGSNSLHPHSHRLAPLVVLGMMVELLDLLKMLSLFFYNVKGNTMFIVHD
jgi:hypothetical protein